MKGSCSRQRLWLPESASPVRTMESRASQDTNCPLFSGLNNTIVPEESLELINVEHPRP